MEPNIVFGLCIGCFVVGLALGFALFRGGDSEATEKVEKAEAELTQYKEAVNEHFSETAEHFKALGRNYRELYEHMARGSETLMGGGEGTAVPFVPMEQLLAAPDEDTSTDETVVAEQETSDADAQSGDAIVAEAEPDAVAQSDADDGPSVAEHTEAGEQAGSQDTAAQDANEETVTVAVEDDNQPAESAPELEADDDNAFSEETVDDIRLAEAAGELGEEVSDGDASAGDEVVEERRSA